MDVAACGDTSYMLFHVLVEVCDNVMSSIFFGNTSNVSDSPRDALSFDKNQLPQSVEGGSPQPRQCINDTIDMH
jgi:hypothetical protein